ncbi:MAG: hypothetical protein QXK37_04215, partial [Candidatus Woesearchaeota archaeon]
WFLNVHTRWMLTHFLNAAFVIEKFLYKFSLFNPMVEKSLQELQQEDKARKCPDCGSTNIDVEGEELYCRKCGLVFE